ncbi:hypothetical protein TVAG_201640 [Trichomonas vaginalis G3]|uniref:Uncharacterized protein n=1 Tax=Trichomonas vaginalis (strain ATCC PRA-98 / G3) TaxID=412133 RepID=A2DWI5_TRIV3|nr:WD repeat-containing protein 97 family [Trichomonas vaginalis G3]EAY15170.1 hypothetical protein TVAG_201640 [Trichomonas vaginalis G3]KAI5550680.1 WD repeat-containing protein 97 family [Trichomonas vaginalis G3]|eukprot:XP_001327393.1 hypothetical protein [Trichomonas vaginalis G3]
MPKYSRLITVGEHLTIWDFKFIPSPPTIEFQPAKLIIIKINVILPYTKIQIINPPVINQNTGEIFVCNKDGNLTCYDKNGKYADTMFNNLDYDQFAFDCFQETGEMLSVDPSNGLTLWHTKNVAIAQYSIPSQYIVSIRFINEEFAMILTTNQQIILADYRTGFSYTCYTPKEQVTRFFVFNSHLYLICRNEIIVLEPIMPWRLWTRTSIPPVYVKRVEKRNSAARILVLCQNCQIRLLSPRNGQIITALTLSNTSTVQSLMYDRGYDDILHDILFINFSDGKTSVYSTGQSPCIEQSQIHMKATSTLVLRLPDDRLVYAIGTSIGHVILCDYETLKQIGHFFVTTMPITKVFYYRRTNSLIILSAYEVFLFSIYNGTIVHKIDLKSGELAELFNDNLVVDIGNGEMAVIDLLSSSKLVRNKQFNGTKFHQGKITSISCSSHFLLTSSEDCSIRVWTKSLSLYAALEFPVPITCVCFLNGKRDIIVGADDNLMIINRNLLFEMNDEEDDVYDNYDKLRDELMHETIRIVMEEEEEEIETLLNKTKESEKTPTKRQSIRRRFMDRMLEERRKRMEESLKKSEQWEPTQNDMENTINFALQMEEEIKKEEDKMRKEEQAQLEWESKKKLMEEEEYVYDEEDEDEIVQTIPQKAPIQIVENVEEKIEKPEENKIDNDLTLYLSDDNNSYDSIMEASSRRSSRRNSGRSSAADYVRNSISRMSQKSTNSISNNKNSESRMSQKSTNSAANNRKTDSRMSQRSNNSISNNKDSPESRKSQKSVKENVLKSVSESDDEVEKIENNPKIETKAKHPNIPRIPVKPPKIPESSKPKRINNNTQVKSARRYKDENKVEQKIDKNIPEKQEENNEKTEEEKSTISNKSMESINSSKKSLKQEEKPKEVEEKTITLNIEEIRFKQLVNKGQIKAKKNKNESKYEIVSHTQNTQQNNQTTQQNNQKIKPKIETVPEFRNDPDRFDFDPSKTPKYSMRNLKPKEPKMSEKSNYSSKKFRAKKQKNTELYRIPTSPERAPIVKESKRQNTPEEKQVRIPKKYILTTQKNKFFSQRQETPQPKKRFNPLGVYERQTARHRKRASTPVPHKFGIYFDYDFPYNVIYDVDIIRDQTKNGNQKYSIILKRKEIEDHAMNPEKNCFVPDNYEKPETKYIIKEEEIEELDLDDIISRIRDVEILREYRESKRKKKAKSVKKSLFSSLIPLSLQRGRIPAFSNAFKSPFATRRFNEVVDIKSPQEKGVLVLRGNRLQTSLPRL